MIYALMLFASVESLQSSPQPYFSLKDGSFGKKIEWGCSDAVAQKAIGCACQLVYGDEGGWPEGATFDTITKRLSQHADAALASNGSSSPSRLLKEIVLANVCSAFVVRWLSYDSETARLSESDPKFGHLTVERGLPEVVIKTRTAVCYGYARFQRELARKLGLDCVMTGGSFRGVKADRMVDEPNHMWVTYRFPGGLWAPSDTNTYQGFVPQTIKRRGAWRVKGKIGSHFLVVLEPEAREVFHTMHLAWDRYPIRDGDQQRIFIPPGVTTQTWNHLAETNPVVPKMAFEFFGWYQHRDELAAE